MFILGRQPEISLAELRAVFGNAELILPNVALVKTESADIDRLGGVRKVGRVIWDQTGEANKFLIDKFSALPDGKITLGISHYGRDTSAREAQKTGIFLKKHLSRSMRILPNSEPEISDAATLGNRLGASPNKVELMMARAGHRLIIAELIGVQDLNTYTLRDRGRPKRDARVGMLPPKLAQTMINLAVRPAESLSSDFGRGCAKGNGPCEEDRAAPRNDGRVPNLCPDETLLRDSAVKAKTLLDPFCGTGVVLQEAALMGLKAYGTDLEPRMIDYSRTNLDWLAQKFRREIPYLLNVGDATEFTWEQPIGFVATETYLGRPYSFTPTEENLGENITNCNLILTKFLQNLLKQITSETGLCIAVPCWFINDRTRHLPLTKKLTEFGYEQISYSEGNQSLIYHREDQIVGRELLVLKKKQ
ncbi:hypothetical protein FWG95_02080 [Candidatus Saccharibacteria bacterium]|nr:hypothetical protein [Candidatus Saccharibacteria bacterium]